MPKELCEHCGKELRVGGDGTTHYFYCDCGFKGKDKGTKQVEPKTVRELAEELLIKTAPYDFEYVKAVFSKEINDFLSSLALAIKDVIGKDNKEDFRIGRIDLNINELKSKQRSKVDELCGLTQSERSGI